MPGPDAACSAYLVESGDHHLLLDIGTGSAGPLQRFATVEQLDTIVVSHAHSDHCGDLDHVGYLLERAGAPPVRVVGASDLRPYVWENPGVFSAMHASAEPFRVGPMSVRLAAVDHQECWATRVDDRLCYTADTAPCAALDELAAGCEVLLAEASGSDVDGPLPRHLTAGDAARLALRCGARLLVLTHLRPWLDHGALLAEAAEIAPCPVVLASPGLQVAL